MTHTNSDGERFIAITGFAFVGLLVLLMMTEFALAMAGVVGVATLYLILATAFGIGYYGTTRTDTLK